MKTISVITGQYEKNWETKKQYSNIWVVFEKENWKMSIKFEPIVANYLKLLFWANFDWWASIYEKDNNKPMTDKLPEWDEWMPF